MKKSAVLLLLLSIGSASAAPTEPDLQAMLKRMVAGGDYSDFKLHVQWVGKFGQFPGRDAVIYGKGVGILNRKEQFTLPKADVKALIKLLAEKNVGKFKAHYGGNAFPGRRGGARGGAARPARVPERLLGEITVTIGGFSKSTTQMAGGEQSKPLADLADALLTICEKAAKKNPVTADTLAAGLKKLGTGELLPETLNVLVHRIIQKRPLNQSTGFLMRIEGRNVTVQQRIPKKGYSPKKKLVLSDKEFTKLTSLMAENEPAAFPVNLWAEHYTDFNFGVLQHRKSLQARQFARMTPKTHGEKQKQFDRIFAYMKDLAARTEKNGKVVPENRQ